MSTDVAPAASTAASPYYQPPTYPSASFESMTPWDEALPVVVVGGGPVGMAVALGLARRGTPVTVLESANQVSFGSRAICVSRHSLEVADRLGLGDALSGLVLPWEGGRSFYRDEEVLHFRMRNEDHDVRGPMVNVSQSELEQVMVEALLVHPLVTFHWGSAVTGCTSVETASGESGDEVTLEVATEAGPRTLRAQWVVAADGGRSRMRELAGLSLAGNSYEGRYVIADIHWESDLPAERMVWFDPPSNPGSTVIMHRQPNDIWRIDYQLDPSEDAEVEVKEDRIRARIASHLDWLRNDLPWTLEWHGFYKAHALALDGFVHGRIVFAGDAAHLVPIFGVRGLNSGMEDAETLAWTLSAVLRAGADPALLEAYAAERRHAWTQNVANAGKSTLIMSPGSHGHRTTRDAVLALATARPEFSHLVNPRQSSATHARASALTVPSTAPVGSGLQPGDPVEDRAVRLTGGKRSSLNELRGPGFGLFGVDLDEGQQAELSGLATALSSALVSEDVAVTLVSTGPDTSPAAQAGPDVVDDSDGSLAAAWGATPGEVLVVRPDGLLLARGSATQLSGIPPHVLGGGAARADVSQDHVDVALDAHEARRESAWLALSEGLDSVTADDREGFLSRLALLLGDQLDPDSFRTAVSVAAGVR